MCPFGVIPVLVCMTCLELNSWILVKVQYMGGGELGGSVTWGAPLRKLMKGNVADVVRHFLSFELVEGLCHT